MGLIRTIIVDDSAFVRKVVKEMLSQSPQIEVVGTAANGEDALRLVEELGPDVVTCDLMMPVLDGIGFVRRQMARKPLPVLILAASAMDGELVLEALDAGAIDFIQKPTALASNHLLTLRDELIQKVKAAALTPGHLPILVPAVPAVKVPLAAHPAVRKQIDIVVIGISTGGPQALRFLVPQFAADFPVPLVIVLHMPVGYTALFAQKLAEISTLPVKEASEGCAVQPGEMLLAPAGRHMTFKRMGPAEVRARLSVQPMNKPHRPSVDVLFESAAETYGRRVLGVVMTGMGDDGTIGARRIKDSGGTILTQDEASSVIYGMPRCVKEAGLSDASVPLTSMAEEISKRV
jgi:two-component system chemotaxis response regulator CheB